MKAVFAKDIEEIESEQRALISQGETFCTLRQTLHAMLSQRTLYLKQLPMK